MIVNIHQSDTRGNVFALVHPAKTTWRGKSFLVPRGFESDGFSTPRCLWSTISPAIDPRTLRAAVNHDYIYREQPDGWTRAEADAMLLCQAFEDGLGFWRSIKAYVGLRLFGGKAWRDNARRRRLEALN